MVMRTAEATGGRSARWDGVQPDARRTPDRGELVSDPDRAPPEAVRVVEVDQIFEGGA
jgi:hypothetical protein